MPSRWNLRLAAACVLGLALCAVSAAGFAQEGSSLAADRYHARETDPAGARALCRVLADYYRRGDGEGGFGFWMSLGVTVRARQMDVPEVLHWRNLLEFLRDARRGDAGSCAVSGQNVLHDPRVGCDYPVQLARYQQCIGPLPQERREQLMDGIRRETSANAQRAADCPSSTAR